MCVYELKCVCVHQGVCMGVWSLYECVSEYISECVSCVNMCMSVCVCVFCVHRRVCA